MLTAFDVALNLCNIALVLEIAPKKVREHHILKHKRVRRSVLAARLRAFGQLAAHYDEERQELLHHGVERTLEELDGQSFIELSQKVGGYRLTVDQRNAVHFTIDAGLVGVLKRARSDRDALQTAIDDLFDALLPVYDRVTEILDRRNAPK